MHLQKLKLFNFRNYRELSMEFSPQVNFIYGPNGAGKTNILEAIQLVCLGESFRTKQTEVFHMHGENYEPLVKADLNSNGSNHQLMFQVKSGKKNLFRNEKRESRKNRLKSISTVIFSPESLSVIKNEPSLRRKLLDEIAISLFPETLSSFVDYTRALKSRNELLKRFLDEPSATRSKTFQNHLESLNEVYLRTASDVTFCRLKCLEKLSKKFTLNSQKVLEFQDVDISVDYVISGHSSIDWSLETVYDAHLSRMRELESAEKASGRTLVGPGRHELRFLFNGHDARSFCSQGQQRALILALKISQIEAHEELHNDSPILILDDVLSELDRKRCESLVGVLQQTNAQTFITTTDKEQEALVKQREFFCFQVNNGVVERER